MNKACDDDDDNDGVYSVGGSLTILYMCVCVLSQIISLALRILDGNSVFC